MVFKDLNTTIKELRILKKETISTIINVVWA